MNKEISVGNVKQKKSVFRSFCNAGFFVLLITLTFYILLRDQNLGELWNTICKINPIWIIVAIGCMILFVCCEGINICVGLNMLGKTHGLNLLSCIRYAVYGYFYSNITPSSTGGQPMQIYEMHKDGIDISQSSIILLLILANYQTVTVSYALISFAIRFEELKNVGTSITLLLGIGIFFNLIVLTLLIISIFFKKASSCLLHGLVSLLHRLHIEKADKIGQKIETQLTEYHRCSACIRANPMRIFSIFLITCIQIALLHSIPYWIYCSFGLSDYSLFNIMTMQAVLYMTLSAVPLPGGIGVSESGFLILYRALFPAALLSSAMLVYRGISFYFCVALSGLLILLFKIIITIKSRKRACKASL